MSLQELLKSATKTAFDALLDIAQTMTIRHTSQGEYDPIEGTVTGVTVQDYQCRGVFLNYNYKDAALSINSQANTATSISGDKKVLIEADSLDYRPMPNDILIVGTEEYIICSIKETKPGNVSFIYELQIKVS